MKYIKRKRNLENHTVRNIPDSVLITNANGDTVIDENSPNYFYGKVPKDKIDENGDYILDFAGNKIPNTINVDIFITQKLDDLGLFTDTPFTPSTTILTQKPVGFSAMEYGRLPGAPANFYYDTPTPTTGTTDDGYLKNVISLRIDKITKQPIYVPNLNVSKDFKNSFDGITSVDNVNNIIKYKIGADVNNVSNTGVEFITYLDKIIKSTTIDGQEVSWKKTEFNYMQGGWNAGNTSLSAIMKEEEYLGVVFPPEIRSDVFINRGVADIFERHCALSEIKTTNDMDNFRGGWLTTE